MMRFKKPAASQSIPSIGIDETAEYAHVYVQIVEHIILLLISGFLS